MTTISLISALGHTSHQTTLYTVKPPQVPTTSNFKIHIVEQQGKFLPFWRYQRMKEVKKIFKDAKKEELLLIMSGGLSLEETDVKRTLLYCHSSFSAEVDFLQKKFANIEGFYFKMIQKNMQKSILRLKDDSVCLISNSNYTRESIKELSGKDSPVVYPPVRIQDFLSFQKLPKKEKIITISRFSEEKNLEFAISVINETGVEYDLFSNAMYKKQFAIYEELKNRVKQNISLHCNEPREQILENLASSKVYFHTSVETFGISVVEAIASGCIPIVPNNSGHKETVPFEELRYTDRKDAKEKLAYAVSGKYDYLRPKLQEHIEQFSESIFQENMLGIIQS